MRRYIADVGLGTVRFIGLHAETQKPRLGIELDEPKGKHNGTSKGMHWPSQQATMLVHSFDLSGSCACTLGRVQEQQRKRVPLSDAWLDPRLARADSDQ